MRRSASDTERALTPQNLLNDFGARTPLARESIQMLLEALGGNAGQRLFALQTYYATLVKLLAERFGFDNIDDLPSGNPFAWCMTHESPAVGHWIERLRKTMARFRLAPPDEGPCDLFKPLYENLFPRKLRHRLGEYYTPDWLAEHVLDQVGYTGRPDQRLLDPTCGSGTFLLLALRRARRRENGTHASVFSPLSPLPSPLAGFDLNPLAVMTARANYLIALADLPSDERPAVAPIYLRDAILDGGAANEAERFDFVVGNPPWIAWDNLPEETRQATRPFWERYGLFSLSGNDARHGGAKKDLSMLVIYAAADRHLKSGGHLGMVISQTLLQIRGAGDGFRRFRLGEDGPPLEVVRVDDLTALRPFAGAASRTGVVVLKKGTETEYPVRYFLWRERNVSEACLAHPIDTAKPTSPWRIEERGQNHFATTTSFISDVPFYTAHLGANSGGANGVYWLDILEERPDGMLVRNMAVKGKRFVETVEQVIEPDLLYPLLRWGDVARYRAVPSGHLLLAQDPNTRTGIDETRMRRDFPQTLAYLEQFRKLLVSRAAYRRYQGRGPFYSMYNVGPYTVAPIKVVWRRMDRQLNAAVVESLAVPQETCVLVACSTADEAHYLCAMLNSAVVNRWVGAHCVRGGKGFGTPGTLENLPLDRYRPGDPQHVELASQSRLAHAAALLPDEQGKEQVATIQRKIDELAGNLWT